MITFINKQTEQYNSYTEQYLRFQYKKLEEVPFNIPKMLLPFGIHRKTGAIVFMWQYVFGIVPVSEVLTNSTMALALNADQVIKASNNLAKAVLDLSKIGVKFKV